jgi:hypothetical protein
MFDTAHDFCASSARDYTDIRGISATPVIGEAEG